MIPAPNELGRPRRRTPNVNRVFKGAALVVAGLLLGAGCASANPRTVEVTRDVPGPTVTKEVEVPGPTVTVEAVPDSCLTALQHADTGFSTLSDVMQAILDGDIAAADVGNAKLGSVAPLYNAAKTDCRAGR